MKSARLILPTLEFEQHLWQGGFVRLAGVDEAGRGAWAGPVSAAAVIFPEDPLLINALNKVRDSKLMTPLERRAWAPRIKESALAWGVGFASVEEIDQLGILPATRLAARRAFENLAVDYLITDYLLFRELDLPQTALVKGDQRSLSISAASVLAKTARDGLMCELDQHYPCYQFARHKGYGTELHRDAILQWGLCDIHRRSFSLPVQPRAKPASRIYKVK